MHAGEFITVLGPNGAGKSTLLKLLLGLVRPSAGEVRVFDQRARRGRADIGYVPQRRTLDSDLSVRGRDFVRLGLDGKRLRNRDVVIGSLLAWSLGLGTLFIFLYHDYAENAYAILFGQILGVGQEDVVLVVGASLVALVALSVSEATEAVGALLILMLLVTPAAIARNVCTRPFSAMALSAGLALCFVWTGLVLAFYVHAPYSFLITTLAFGTFVVVELGRWLLIWLRPAELRPAELRSLE